VEPLRYVEEIDIKALDASKRETAGGGEGYGSKVVAETQLPALDGEGYTSKFVAEKPGSTQLRLSSGVDSALGMEEFLGVHMDLLHQKRQGSLDTIRQEVTPRPPVFGSEPALALHLPSYKQVQDAVNLPWDQKPWLPSEQAAEKDAAEHLKNVKYVLDEKAFEEEVASNHGGTQTRDTGHGGNTLQVRPLTAPTSDT